MFSKRFCFLLVAFSQVMFIKMCDIPKGLIRAADVYFLPWTPATEKATFPKDRVDSDMRTSDASCTLGVVCKIGDKVVESSVKDITGPKGPRGKRGLQGQLGRPGTPGPPDPAGCSVAFVVSLESKYIGYVGADVPLQFDKVIMNKGNAFDVEKGTFTAPSNGTYVFDFTVGAQRGRKGAAHLRLNGKFMATVWAESIKSWGSASNRLVLDLTPGDALRFIVSKNAPYLRDGLHTSLRGWCM